MATIAKIVRGLTILGKYTTGGTECPVEVDVDALYVPEILGKLHRGDENDLERNGWKFDNEARVWCIYL